MATSNRRQFLPPFAPAATTSAPAPVRRAAAGVNLPRIRADYESARSTIDNVNLWAMADGLSADASISVPVRHRLRNRSRYEVANNSYLKGAQLTIANDTIGVGPSLQMNVKPAAGTGRVVDGLTEDQAKELNSFLEDEFDDWAREVRLAEKMRTARAGRFESGECFLMFVSNPRLRHPVKLDVAVIEADQVADPTFATATLRADPRWNDGIMHDEWGNPISYRVLKYHPGGTAAWMMGLGPDDYQDVPAEFIYHDFRRDRPGQTRGIPEITPALQTIAEVRRFTAAVLDASEWAARASGTIEAPVAPSVDEEDEVIVPDTMDEVPMARRGLMVLPPGYKANQMEAQQPVTTYGDFLYKKLGEVGRCFNFPLTMMNLDSSTSNLSARYLDVQPYVRDRQMERDAYNCFLDRIADLFLMFAEGVPGYMPATADRYPHEWVWPELGKHADPDKVAGAQTQGLKNGTITLPDIYSAKGENWERKQEAAAKALGVDVEEYQGLVRLGIFGVAPAGSTELPAEEAENTPGTGPTPPKNGHKQAQNPSQTVDS